MVANTHDGVVVDGVAASGLGVGLGLVKFGNFEFRGLPSLASIQNLNKL